MLKINNLHFSYSDEPLLEDISFEVKPAEKVGIIGPNGSGKSTLIKLIAGLINPLKGKIEIDGGLISDVNRKMLAKKMAYVPQSVDIKFNFPVYDVVAMGRFPYSENLIMHDKLSEQVVLDAILKMNLEKLQRRNFSELSGGEKQRTIIASALAQQSNLLLLDEPTSALDFKHQQEIFMLLKELCTQQGKTVLVVTHDINLAAQFCDKLIMIHNGKVVIMGKPQDVLKFNLIQDVYGVKVYIDINPMTESIYILPYELETKADKR